MIPTPKLDHFTREDYKKIYEPSEDTFLFLDTLEEQKDFILNEIDPQLIVEIGPGSGCIISFVSSLLGCSRLYLAVDINMDACISTKRTLIHNQNNAIIEIVNCDMLKSFKLSNLVDLIIFNPPYVPTGEDELGKRDITASYAGGIDGTQVLYELLPTLPLILSPKGYFYCILLQKNKPKKIIEYMKELGFDSKVVNKRKAGIELLYVIKFWKNKAK